MTVRNTGRRTAALLFLFAATACSSEARSAAPSPTPSPSASASPSPSPTPSPQLVSPFTGLPVKSLGRVIALKIDNAPLARPQSGLDKADVVYEELVEGRTTRFLAIFSSQAAGTIGPVRSVRDSDLELLKAYGRVLFGFSGGNTGVKASVRRADVIDVSYDAATAAYWKAGRRRDAINYMTSTARLLGFRKDGAVARDVGFRFGADYDAAAAPGAKPSAGVTVNWGRAVTAFKYDAAKQVWQRWMDGAPAMVAGGGQMAAPTVVVQQVRVTRSRYSDVTGSNSPYTVTTGSGKGLVLRDGVAIPLQWKRTGNGATRYLDRNGDDILLKPGPVWVVLAPTNAPIDWK